MILKKWEDLPEQFKCPEVEPYYNILSRKKTSLLFKRLFDIILSGLMLIVTSPIFLCLAILIKLDSKGPVFFRQTRVTQYGREFKIFKFRTMVQNAEKIGTKVTVSGDSRITRVGKLIRRCRLDELSQLIDVFRGTMTFVGTRPEVPKYVDAYTPEMLATLLLPAGVTSLASILYKDEDELLKEAQDADRVYITKVLPDKMAYNLNSIKNFSFWGDIKTMFKTVWAVIS